MTACVNNEKKMKGGALSGKVARTFLAGALAATMVPSVAYATDDAKVQSDSTVEMLGSIELTDIESGADHERMGVSFVEGESTYTGEDIEVSLDFSGELCNAGKTESSSVDSFDDIYWVIVDENGTKVSEGQTTGKTIASDGGILAINNSGIKDAGKYYFKWNGTWAKMTYGQTTNDISFTVEKAVPTAKWSDGEDSKSVKYTGSECVISGDEISVTGISGEKFIAGKDFYFETDESPVEPGDYKVKIGSKGTDATKNYDFDAISPLTLTVEAISDGIEAAWDGEVIGWTGGDQSELASKHVKATFKKLDGKVYTLVQGTEADVKAGKADYWVSWNAPVVGSNAEDVDYEATLHYGGKFSGTDTVKMTVYAVDAATAAEDFVNGKITKAVDNEGNSLSGAFEFTYDRGIHYVIPEEVTTVSGKVIDVDATDSKGNPYYNVVYGQPFPNLVDAGSYTLYVTATKYNPDYAEGTSLRADFVINKAQLKASDIVIEDEYDPAFTWNGVDRLNEDSFDYVWDGADLKAGTEFNVDYYRLNDAKLDEIHHMIDPGDYVAKVTGTGNFEGTVELDITISPMDLSKTVLTVDDMTEQNVPYASSIPVLASFTRNGKAMAVNINDHANSLVDLAITSGQKTITEKGSYALAVTPDKKANEDVSFVTGEGKVSFAVVGEVVTDFQYKGTAFGDVKNVVFNLDRGEALNTDDIAVYDEDGEKLDSSEWTLAVTDLEGNVVTDWEKKAGDYIATVSVNYGSDYAMGGKASFAFSVTEGSLAEADVFVTFDGKVCGNKNFPFGNLYWNGSDQSDRFGVKIVKDGKVLSEGDDYEWYFVDQATNKRVDSLTAVGEYTLRVEGTGWAGSFDMVTGIEVDALEIGLMADGMKSFPQRNGLPVNAYAYTGQAIAPSFKWIASVADDYYAGLEGLLETADYTVTYRDALNNIVEPEDLIAEGTYTAEIELTADGASKFTPKSFKIEFQILDRIHFQDVLAKEWYSESVYDAWAAGYINGYNEGKTPLFGPEDTIKRGDVACILYNVASNAKHADVDSTPAGSAVGTYSEFSDVEVGVYWTAPINWAAKAGIVSGYGNDAFGPSDQITREQFASMLANYAKVLRIESEKGVDIAGMPGEDSVSDWARPNVEWAVANGIMGNNGANLNGQGFITRAEATAMVMNFVKAFNLA